jgi:hypothetical protein
VPAAQQAPRGKAKGQSKAAAPQAGGQAGGNANSGGSVQNGQAKGHSHANGGGSRETTGGGSQQQSSSHAKAGKVTLCHATGSETNPYVEITISANALPAHQRHQDGRDIYPVPAGGCPGGESPSGGGGGGGQDKEHAKVTICHATGSETNPYVLITVDEHALKAHMSHQNGEDIVNPTGPCPGATIPAGVGNPPSGMVSPGGQLPAAGVLGVSEESGGPTGAPEVENAVLGAEQGSGPEEAAQEVGDAGTSLPFTGLQLLVMAALGLGLGAAGLRLRRSAA